MKLEQFENSLLFSTTSIPDAFFTEYYSQASSDAIKVFLYLYFLSKYGKEIKINEWNENLLLDDSFEDKFENKEKLLNICKKIHRLDEKTKEVVYLRIGTNFNFRKISNIIGQSEDYARTIFYRAKIKLKE